MEAGSNDEGQPFRHLAGDTDDSGMSDEIIVEINGEVIVNEVKGPDPAQWGEDVVRPRPREDLTSELKGPDETWSA